MATVDTVWLYKLYKWLVDTEAVICIFYDHYVVINNIDTIKDQKQQKTAKQKSIKNLCITTGKHSQYVPTTWKQLELILIPRVRINKESDNLLTPIGH